MKIIEVKKIDLIKKEFKKIKRLNKRTKLRMKALKMAAKGLSRKEINIKLAIGHNTLVRWVKQANKFGTKGLLEKEGRGKKSVLTAEQVNGLKKILKNKPSDYGYVGSKWNGKILKVYIERELKVKLQKTRIYELLKMGR